MTKLKITRETAQKIVEAGTTPKYVSTQEILPPEFDADFGADVRLARLRPHGSGTRTFGR